MIINRHYCLKGVIGVTGVLAAAGWVAAIRAGKERERLDVLRQTVYRHADLDNNGILSEIELYTLGVDLGVVNKGDSLPPGELEKRVHNAPVSVYLNYIAYLAGEQVERAAGY